MKLISYISGFMIPFLLFYVVGHGLLSKRDIYSDFLEGAKEGLKTVKGLIPVLIGLMTAVGVLRASGFLDFLGEILGKVTSAAGIPPQIVPLGIVRLFSSSAATGLLLDIFKEFGADGRSDAQLHRKCFLLHERIFWLCRHTENKIYTDRRACCYVGRDGSFGVDCYLCDVVTAKYSGLFLLSD